MKLTISRNTSVGEQVVLEVPLSGLSDAHPASPRDAAKIAQAFRIIDARAYEMVQRVMRANARHKKLARENPEAYRAAFEVQEELFGQRLANMPDDLGVVVSPDVEAPQAVVVGSDDGPRPEG